MVWTVAILRVLVPLLLASLSFASPLYGTNMDANSSAITIKTPLGVATGSMGDSGTARFAVRYATANRWQESTVASSWDLPSGVTNAMGSPLPCPQPGLTPSSYSEDCLSMIIYVPQNIGNNVNTLMWIHGGSFIIGSAADPALDGSNLAAATNSIVAVVQYRLGTLGFMPPNGNTNLAIKDLINAMKFAKQVASSFGGSTQITLAGQSSGATMIRSLLAVPSASSLFKSAILHSDPMNYGFLSPSTQRLLQSNYNSLIGCTGSNTSCWNSLSLDTILTTQMSLYYNAPSIAPSAGPAEPIRPVLDGSLLTSPLDNTAPFPTVTKPLMISTVATEAGPDIYGPFPSPLNESLFKPICNASLGPQRTAAIISSPYYAPVKLSDGTVDARAQLQLLGTDQLWRCPSWTFARSWVQHGGKVYVAEYTVGATYPANTGIPFCTQSGSVCHQDDIMIVFGTMSNPSPVQSALSTEVQKRYKAFILTGQPNAQGLDTWSATSASTVIAFNLGSSGHIAVGACQTSFWGQSVLFDYQVFKN